MTYELDENQLNSVSVHALRSYLVERGWVNRKKTETSDIYRITFPEYWDEVSVPNHKEYYDYPQQIENIIDTLSKIEKRCPREIFSDIVIGNVADAVQYRLMIGDDSGTVPVDWIIQILESHVNISAAAYMDILKPAPFHSSLNEGRRALKEMRMGQTQYGSFIVKLYYPFIGEKQRTLSGGLAGNEIFRKLTTKILDSVQTISDCAIDNVDLPSNCNISYNFVDYVLTLRSDQGYGMEMKNITYDTRRSKTIELVDKIFPSIESIADQLKPHSEEGARGFSGHIYSLSEVGFEETDSTRFKIEYFDEEGFAKATLYLSGQERNIALESIKERKLVSFEGKLKGYGRSKTIEEVSNFHII